jgi:hypothetical protein
MGAWVHGWMGPISLSAPQLDGSVPPALAAPGMVEGGHGASRYTGSEAGASIFPDFSLGGLMWPTHG